jgi:hypothetical protein
MLVFLYDANYRPKILCHTPAMQKRNLPRFSPTFVFPNSGFIVPYYPSPDASPLIAEHLWIPWIAGKNPKNEGDRIEIVRAQGYLPLKRYGWQHKIERPRQLQLCSNWHPE